jgi:hypothetical protein
MSDAARAWDRRTAFGTAVIAVLLGLYAMNDVPAGVFQDDGHYLVLARAIATGDGYRYLNLPGAPGATHFPPGYPLLLAPLWLLAPSFPGNLALFKLLNVALLPLAALGVRAVARSSGGLSAGAASALAVVSCATVPTLFLNGLLFSETAFVAALCGVLLISERMAKPVDAPSWRGSLGVGLAIGALAMLRTVGVAVLPAVLLVLAARRRWRDAVAVLVGALAFLVPWQLWTAAHAAEVPAAISGAYGAYGSWLTDAWRAGGPRFALAVLVENLRGLRMPLTLFGMAAAPLVAQLAVGAALLGVALLGAWRLRRTAPVLLLTFVPYGALLLAWPFPPDRFLWPLWPMVLMLVVAGARAGADDPLPRRGRVAVLALTLALGALYGVWHARTWPGRSWESLQRNNAKVGLAAAAVAAALPRDGLVAADQDVMVHLYAGRPAVPLVALTAEQHVRPRTDDEVAAQIAGVLDAYHPRWVLVGQRESLRGVQRLIPLGRLRLAGADPSGVLVYDVVR